MTTQLQLINIIIIIMYGGVPVCLYVVVVPTPRLVRILCALSAVSLRLCAVVKFAIMWLIALVVGRYSWIGEVLEGNGRLIIWVFFFGLSICPEVTQISADTSVRTHRSSVETRIGDLYNRNETHILLVLSASALLVFDSFKLRDVSWEAVKLVCQVW